MGIKEYLQSITYPLPCMTHFRDHSTCEPLRKILSVILIPVGLIKFIISSLFANIQSNKITVAHGVAVVAIMKNEEPYVEEWVRYYSGLGCAVIIYNNDSEGNLTEIGIKSGAIVHEMHGSKRQNDAYNDALRRYRNTYKYMMFFDADEFIASKRFLEGENLEYLIDKYFLKFHKAAGIGINWLIFGSGGHKMKPEGNVTENYKQCSEENYEWNQIIKSIVDPRRIIGFVGPHLPCALFGFGIYDLDGKRILNPRIDFPENKELRLHHYFTKSKKEFEKRISRGMADRNAKRNMEEFYQRDRNEVYNDLADRIYKMIILNETESAKGR